MKFFRGKSRLAIALVAVFILILGGVFFVTYKNSASADQNNDSSFSRPNTPTIEYKHGSFLVKLKTNPDSLKKSFKSKSIPNLNFKNLYSQSTPSITKSQDNTNFNSGLYQLVEVDDSVKDMSKLNKQEKLAKGKDSADPEEIRDQRILELLNSDPNVEFASLNYIRRTNFVPNDPYYQDSHADPTYDKMWGLKNMSPEAGWDTSRGSGVVVAVIDSGVDYNHEDLQDNILKDTNSNIVGYNFTSADSKDFMDRLGHGTHVSGTIAATGNNGIGIIGVAPESKIMPVKVLGDSGSGSDDQIAQGIVFAVDHGASIINMSLGGYGTSQIIDDVLKYAADKNVITVVAAGNSSYDANAFFPAGSQYAIAVSAYDPHGLQAVFTNYGPKIEISAPGVAIVSTISSTNQIPSDKIIDKKYAMLDGTSMASPHIAGAIALLKSKNTSWSTKDLREALKQTAAEAGKQGVDDLFGFGKPNLTNAVNVSLPPITPEVAVSSLDKSNVDFMIRGMANDTNFSNYQLDFRRLDVNSSSPEDYSSLKSSSTAVSAISNLAKFSVRGRPNGTYYLRLSATNQSGNRSMTFKKVFIATSEISGFPIQINSYSLKTFPIKTKSGNALLASDSSHVWIYNKSGKLINSLTAADNEVFGEFVASDVNGDGFDEIIFQVGDIFTNFGQKIKIYSQNFVKIGEFQTEAYSYGLSSYDFNNDGQKEIFVQEMNFDFYHGFKTDFFKYKIFNKNGQLLSQKNLQGAEDKALRCYSTAIGDLGNDQLGNVVALCIHDDADNNQKVELVYLNDKLEYDWRLPIQSGNNYDYPDSVMLFDTNNDSKLEVIYRQPYNADPSNVFDTSTEIGIVADGKLIKKINKPHDYIVSITPYYDKKLYIPAVIYQSTTNNNEYFRIEMLSIYGKNILPWPYHFKTTMVQNVGPVLAYDGNNDGQIDLTTDVNGAYIANFTRAKLINRRSLDTCVSYRKSLNDINSDGKLELIVTGTKFLADYVSMNGIYAFKTSADANNKNMQWPTYGHDSQNTNNQFNR